MKVQTITKIESRNAPDGTHQEVVLNGEAKDAAYVFVEQVIGSNEYENLATLANCKTDGVSAKITVTPKATGKKGPKISPKKTN